MNNVIRFLSQGCAALAFLAGLGCIVAAFTATSTVWQEIAWGTFAVACFSIATLMLVSIGVTYLEEIARDKPRM